MKYKTLATGRNTKYTTAIITADKEEGAVAGEASLSASVGRCATNGTLLGTADEAELAGERA